MKLFSIEGVFLVPLMRLKIGGIFGTVIPLFRKEWQKSTRKTGWNPVDPGRESLIFEKNPLSGRQVSFSTDGFRGVQKLRVDNYAKSEPSVPPKMGKTWVWLDLSHINWFSNRLNFIKASNQLIQSIQSSTPLKSHPQKLSQKTNFTKRGSLKVEADFLHSSLKQRAPFLFFCHKNPHRWWNSLEKNHKNQRSPRTYLLVTMTHGPGTGTAPKAAKSSQKKASAALSDFGLGGAVGLPREILKTKQELVDVLLIGKDFQEMINQIKRGDKLDISHLHPCMVDLLLILKLQLKLNLFAICVTRWAPTSLPHFFFVFSLKMWLFVTTWTCEGCVVLNFDVWT